MKVILFLSLYLLVSTTYGGTETRKVSFEEAMLGIPSQWMNFERKGCLLIGERSVDTNDYLKICKYTSDNDKVYFSMNDDGEWEAVTEGAPVLADVNFTSKFKGMSAIVSCRIRDDAGYHSTQCFQAEIDLPENISYIFTGIGNSSFFEQYKKIYLSFNVIDK